MKIGKIALTLFGTGLCMMLLVGCSSKQEKSQPADEITVPGADRELTQTEDRQTANISDEQAQKIVGAYLQLKDALVQTDGEAASNAANNLVALIGKSSEAVAGEIRANAEKIASTEEAEQQRKSFEELSNAVYNMVKSSEAFGMKLYRQYCPMAMNNEGAYWISANEEIRNPYFGDKMLKCGNVEEVIN